MCKLEYLTRFSLRLKKIVMPVKMSMTSRLLTISVCNILYKICRNLSPKFSAKCSVMFVFSSKTFGKSSGNLSNTNNSSDFLEWVEVAHAECKKLCEGKKGKNRSSAKRKKLFETSEVALTLTDITIPFKLKSPRDPRGRVASVSPTRSPSPSSPRLQQRQRQGTMSRDTPPRTMDTQSRGRLSRKSKSMQELNSVFVDGRSPSYSKPTSSSIRKHSVTGENSPRDVGTGVAEQNRRKSLATSSRRSSNAGGQGESSSARSRLSSSGPVGSQRPVPSTVSRSASFGSRPRTLIPVMEPRSKSTVSSRPTRETQRRASSAQPGKVENKGEYWQRTLMSFGCGEGGGVSCLG